MRNEIIVPSGSYTRNINGTDKTFLIFEYMAYGVQYKNYSIELPKGFKPNEVFAVHDGQGTLELIAKRTHHSSSSSPFQQ